MCIQCEVHLLLTSVRNREPATIAGWRRHVVPPPNHPNHSQLGFRVHPPNEPQGGLSCAICFPAVFHNTTTFHRKPQLRWIGVGLWVLPASTRSKGFRQTTHTWPFAPCEGRSMCKHLPLKCFWGPALQIPREPNTPELRNIP